MCELAGGTVCTPGQIATPLTDADIERIVFSGPSPIIDIGARTRIFTGALRLAIEIRDRHRAHGAHPGCTVPAEHCHIDHITEHRNGAPPPSTMAASSAPTTTANAPAAPPHPPPAPDHRRARGASSEPLRRPDRPLS